MPAQVVSSIENNFTKGLVTESTGLNFPENAATDTDNCNYTLIGDVERRLGINFENHYTPTTITTANSAINTYKWNNAGGDGNQQLLVVQVGITLRFYDITASSEASPLSNHKIAGTVDLTPYVAGSNPELQECQFSDGNGYLFVFNPACDPVYVTYDGGTITSNAIAVQIRDLIGVTETPPIAVDFRPLTLTNPHKYNLLNQGWTQGSGSKTGFTSGSGPNIAIGAAVFTTSTSGLGFVTGDAINFNTTMNTTPGGFFIPAGTSVMGGVVTGYSGTTLNVNITSIYSLAAGVGLGPYAISSTGAGYIDTWFSAIANYPSNADVWWYFKNTSDVFDPATRVPQVTLPSARAPQGHYILNAFSQTRGNATGLSGLTDITTTARPSTGCWFQGRVWYTGVNASQATGTTNDFYTWSETIYFSQTSLTPSDFGNCYQQNDPTSDQLNSLLATDGGTVVIQGSGAIYKLFPIANGLLVFAANGVWFITGSQGIGFSANDYTVTKISAIQSISGTSFVDVQGLPYWWNEEGVYKVTPTQSGQLTVESITVSIIDSFYADIPLSSKKKARGSYDPIEFVIKWIYRSTEATTFTEGYIFNRVLNHNTHNKSFYPFTIGNSASVLGINYVTGPGGVSSLLPSTKYFSASGTSTAFAEEWDDTYKDWGVDDYSSYFITGYKVHGQGQKRFQIPYIYMFSRNEPDYSRLAYSIQGLWDYATSGNSGRWSTKQVTVLDDANFAMLFRRHKIRGMGIVLQFKVESVTGYPFDIMGWSVYETVNQGV